MMKIADFLMELAVMITFAVMLAFGLLVLAIALQFVISFF